MSQCEHKTEEEYGVCNRCSAMRRIAVCAKKMLDARKEYMAQLLVSAKDADELQYSLQDRVKDLEREVNEASILGLWD